MATNLVFATDQQGRNAFAPSTSDLKFRAILTNSNETNITVPTDFDNYIVAFAYQAGTTVWVDLTGATATLPASSSLTSCTAELNPGQRQVKGGTKISIITSNVTAEFCISIYAKP